MHVTLHLRAQGIAQALGVLLGPAETPAQKQFAATERNLAGFDSIRGQPAHVALVAQHPPGLPAADHPEQSECCAGSEGHPRGHHQGPGRQQRDGGGRERDQHGPQLDRRAQQRLDGMAAHGSMPCAVITTG